MDWLPIVAVGLAVGVPTGIECYRRPWFRLSVYHSSEREKEEEESQGFKYLRIRVANRPIRRPVGGVLLRNTATGCIANMWFRPTTEGEHPRRCDLPARWAANSEPYVMFLGADSHEPERRFDITKLEVPYRLDLAPNEDGAALIIAIKYKDDRLAYAQSKDTYLVEGVKQNCSPNLELAAERYELTVRVEAGGIRKEAVFAVYNCGTELYGFRIEKLDAPKPPGYWTWDQPAESCYQDLRPRARAWLDRH